MKVLTESIQATIKELGDEEAAKFFNTSVKTVQAWATGKQEPSLAAGMIIAEKPEVYKALLEEMGVVKKPEGKGSEFDLGAEPEPSPESLITSQIAATVPDVNKFLEQIDGIRPKVRLANPAAATANDILQAVLEGKWSRRVSLLIPFNRNINPQVHFNILAMVRKNPWLGYHQKISQIIQRARNLLAQDFLNSEAEWSLWMDDDMVFPIGDPGFFYQKMKATNFPPEFAGINTIERLMSHGKTMVGGVYAKREAGGILCIQPALTPRHAGDKGLCERLKRGPFNDLVEVDYLATGCAMVHRKVYTDIQAKFPDLAPKAEGEPWDFFGHDVGRSGEDMHFGRLAKEAGHQSFLDCGVFCGHIGNFCFMP